MDSMTRQPPPSLVKRGITGVTDNLPAGARLDVAADFVRIFRPQLEQTFLGLQSVPPQPPHPREGK